MANVFNAPFVQDPDNPLRFTASQRVLTFRLGADGTPELFQEIPSQNITSVHPWDPVQRIFTGTTTWQPPADFDLTVTQTDSATLLLTGMFFAFATAPIQLATATLPLFNPAKPQSLSGVLNIEHGVSLPYSVSQTQRFTVGEAPSHQDECAYLHMTPAPNSTLSCMGNAGVRDIVRRIPLPARFPDQNHDTTS